MLLLLCAFLGQTNAQSTAFVSKGGLSLGAQRWDNTIDRELLWGYHFAMGIESYNNDDDRASFYTQIGYHQRGSSARFQYYNINNPGVFSDPYREKIVFNNAAMQLGIKMRIRNNGAGNARVYYFGGIRGEYSISNNIEELQQLYTCNPASIPIPEGVKPFIFGLTLGAGTEWMFGELVGAQLDLSLNPDMTPQYLYGSIPNVIDYCNPGYPVTIPERRIRNITFEVSLGLRLLRKVVYE